MFMFRRHRIGIHFLSFLLFKMDSLFTDTVCLHHVNCPSVLSYRNVPRPMTPLHFLYFYYPHITLPVF